MAEVAYLTSIEWIPESKGGRTTLPEGPVYKPNLRIGEQEHLWSIAMMPAGARQDDLSGDVIIIPISDSFPHEQMDIGVAVVICEGPRDVAFGRIAERRLAPG